MKIVHLVDYIQPKLGYQEYFLAREHARMGHDVTVVASDRYARFPDYDRTVYPILGKRIVGPGLSECDGFEILRLRASVEIGSRVWLCNLGATIRQLKPDVVICHAMTNFNAARIARLKRKLGFRLIYDEHSLSFVVKRGVLGASFYRLLNFRRMLNSADKIVAVARQCIDVMVEKYEIPGSRIELIPLGADSEMFSFDEQLRHGCRERLGISNQQVVFAYTGRMSHVKAPHEIILAVRNAREQLKRKITLLFVGNLESVYAPTFEASCKALDGFAKVVCIPTVPNKDLVELYSASDVAVWPRQATISAIEAMSCSLPIICPDVVAERCKDSNGIVVKPGDINQLSQAILQLANSDNVRLSMGKRSRKLVEDELSWKVIASRFLE